jgi:predicted aspartyl protease
MHVPITIYKDKSDRETVEALLDSGASGKFINQNYAKDKGYKLKKLQHPIKVYNVDGTPNKRGTINHYVELDINIYG